LREPRGKALDSLSGRVDRARGCPKGVWCALFLVLVFTFPKDWITGHAVQADLRRKRCGLPCIGLPKSVRQRQRSCLFGRDLRSLWQMDFATPGQLDYGSSGSRRFTRIKGADERGLVLIKGALASGSGACFWALKDWIPGQARDDTVCSLVWSVSGVYTFTLS